MQEEDYNPDPKTRICWIRVIACCGVALVAIASASQNMETYLHIPGNLSIIFGTFVAGMWGYEVYCRGSIDDE